MTSSTKPRAFSVEESARFDMSGAERFGEVVHLTKAREVTPSNVERAVETMVGRFAEMGYDPERDYLIHTGPGPLVSIMVAVAVGIAGRRNGVGRVKLLMFESRGSRYVARVLDMARATAPTLG